jgi:hypothetical protein
LAAGQPFLVSGIDLPDVVGALGRVAFGRGLASGQSRCLLREPAPALQGAGAGDGLLRVEILEHDAQVLTAPTGVLFVEKKNLVTKGVGLVGVAVGGSQGGRLGAPEACQEGLDGAWLEVKVGGDGSCGVAQARKAVPDLLTQGERERLRHGVPPNGKGLEKSMVRIPPTGHAQN